MRSDTPNSSVSKDVPDDLQFAEDVLNAYRFYGRRASRKALRTSSAKAIHTWANEPKNETKFFDMVNDATSLLARYKKSQSPVEHLAENKRTVNELKEFIRLSVERSKEEC